jgi:hypothetical protein
LREEFGKQLFRAIAFPGLTNRKKLIPLLLVLNTNLIHIFTYKGAETSIGIKA